MGDANYFEKMSRDSEQDRLEGEKLFVRDRVSEEENKIKGAWLSRGQGRPDRI